ncbi:hypothetical protein VNI00_013021 [Paramarasmius palmivorus]|uniref:Uncharacterized protein n=1 Tax=Paramarasmius palmivorus TaxID=297713 RepID=A0AAW0BZS6_9AGAR
MSSPNLNGQEPSCSINPTDLINSLNACVQSGAVLPPELTNLISRFVSSPANSPGYSLPSLSISTHLPTPPASRTNSNPATPSQTSIPGIPSPPQSPSKRYVFTDVLEDQPTRVDTNVKATNQNICDRLYHFENGTYLEFPQSSENGIGYLIKCDPGDWHSPLGDIVYAHGSPGSIQKKRIRHLLLGNGEVDCTYEYRSCHGVKICPYVDKDQVCVAHNGASRELLKERLSREYDHWKEGDCPSRELFEKTLAFIQSVQRVGCLLAQDIDPVAHAPTQEQAFLQQHHHNLKRGYNPKKPLCPGRIVFGRDWQGLPAVMCEFYSNTCRQHSCQPIDEAFDASYIEAILSGDKEEVIRIEKEASLDYNVGPDVECTWVENISSQRKNCPRVHRDPNTGFLYSPLMEKTKCGVKFHVYTPVEELRDQFPYTLMIVRGTHYHPIPLPTKTPPRLREQIFDLLGSMSEELSELTPRRFIRHPIACAHLKKVFPNNPNATFGNLHPSLSNHSHLASFIKAVKSEVFPKGTGWEGAFKYALPQAITYIYNRCSSSLRDPAKRISY